MILFFLLGQWFAKKEKKQAPEKLKQAHEAFKRDDSIEALRLLNDSFYVPLTCNYNKEEALLALEVVELLEKVLEHIGAERGFLTIDLKPALKTASQHGGEIPEKYIRPVEKFLSKTSKGTLSSIKEIINQVEDGGIFIKEGEFEDDFAVEDYDEIKIVNKAGRMIIFGKALKAISYINEKLVDASPQLKKALLHQRAGCYFMIEDYQAALNDYMTLREAHSDNMLLTASIAETYLKLGDKTSAVEYAQIVIDNDTNIDNMKTADEVLSKAT